MKLLYTIYDRNAFFVRIFSAAVKMWEAYLIGFSSPLFMLCDITAPISYGDALHARTISLALSVTGVTAT